MCTGTLGHYNSLEHFDSTNFSVQPNVITINIYS